MGNCQFCRVRTYTDMHGSESCLKCPVGKSTLSSRSTSIHDCTIGKVKIFHSVRSTTPKAAATVIHQNFNGLNNFGTMKMCSRQGYLELMSVNHSVRSESIIGIDSLFPLTKGLCCVFSLESPHPGDSNKYTQYTIFNIKRQSP